MSKSERITIMKTYLHWLKIILLSLLGVLLLFAVALGVMLASFDDEDYRDVLIRAVHYYSGDTLRIEGPFHIRLSTNPAVTAGGVHLQSASGQYDMALGYVEVQLALKPLLSRILLLERLVVQDATINLVSTAAAEEPSEADRQPLIKGQEEPSTVALLPVLESAVLRNIAINYRKGEQQALHTFSLKDMTVGAEENQQKINVAGHGQIAGLAYRIEGQLGKLAKLMDSGRPYPVALRFSHPEFNVEVDGSITDPVRMQGLQLQLEGNSPNLTAFLGHFGYVLPKLGSFKGQALLYGGLDAPALDKLQLSLNRGKLLNMNVSGKMEDLLTRRGADLQIAIATQDAKFLRWLLPKTFPEFNHGKASAEVREQRGVLLVDKLAVEASDPNGLKLTLRGKTGINDFDAEQVFTGMDVQLRFSAPTTQAAEFFVFEGTPEMGAVAGRARLTSPDKELAIEDVHMTVGSMPELGMIATGRTGRMPLSPDIPNSEYDYKVVVKVDSTARAGRLFFDADWPELGPLTVNEHYRGSKADSRSEFSFHAGGKNYPQTSASGKLHLLSTADKTTLEAIDVTAFVKAAGEMAPGTAPKLLSLMIKGSQENKNKIALDTELSIPDVPRLAEAIHWSLPSLAPVHATGKLTGSVRSARFTGEINVGQTRISGKLSGNIDRQNPDIKATITIPELHLTDFGMKPAPALAASQPVQEPDKAPTDDEETDLVHLPEAKKPSVKEKTVSKAAAMPEQTGPIFSSDPLALEELKGKKLSLALRVDEVKGTAFRIDSVDSVLHLENGLLQVGPVKFAFEGEELLLDGTVDTRQTPPRHRLKIKADNLSLAPIWTHADTTVPVGGSLTLFVDLNSQGQSAHAIAMHLAGEIAFAVKNAQVRQQYLNVLGADIFGWFMDSTLRRREYGAIDCVVLQTKVQQGKINSDTMFLEGKELTLVGKLQIDLGKETIDMEIHPRSRTKLWGNLRPIKVTGKLRDPDVSAVPKGTLAAEGGALIFAPFIYLPARGLGYFGNMLEDEEGTENPCKKYIKHPTDVDKAAPEEQPAPGE